jgi:hypothetical protein
VWAHVEVENTASAFLPKSKMLASNRRLGHFDFWTKETYVLTILFMGSNRHEINDITNYHVASKNISEYHHIVDVPTRLSCGAIGLFS